jgi:hypothetical protein
MLLVEVTPKVPYPILPAALSRPIELVTLLQVGGWWAAAAAAEE